MNNIRIGSLIIVGSGIKAVSHITHESIDVIKTSDKVFFLVADAITREWIKKLNPTSESLHTLYEEGKSRQTTYNQMVDHILISVRNGLRVCVVFYGHPGVFVTPSHEAIKRCREEGFYAEMMPGVSAEDCLFSDLGIDPARYGCQSFEATDFLIRRRHFDKYSTLILWQVGVIGHFDFRIGGYNPKGIQVLIDELGKFYEMDHVVTIYEASQYIICKPRIEHTKLSDLINISLTPISTLYVPPAGKADISQEMLHRLGVHKDDLAK